MVFLGGAGEGKRKPQGTSSMVVFRCTTRVDKQDHFLCYILYIEQWGFRCIMLETIGNGVRGPRCPGQTCAQLKCRQLDDLFHALKTVKGLLHLVPSRTTRSSGYGVLCTCGLCYMLFLLYV
jgi:hypothetical protein